VKIERIAGVDPGTRIVGYCIIEARGSRLLTLAIGTIKPPSRSMPERLRRIFDELDAVFQRHKPNVVAVERVFVGRNPSSALALGLGRGVALLCAARCGARVAEYEAVEAKKAVGADGRAGKESVQRMVRMILRLDEPLPPDAADAGALALCCAGRRPLT
jgi:crossover junction endodeoxyribonuclease RuvC